MSDRIVVMKEGVMQQQGAPSELYNRPVNLDVALFMGYRNLLPVKVAAAPHGFAVTYGDVTMPATMIGPVAGAGGLVAAFKPDDVVIGERGLPATVDSVIYGGRESTVKMTLDSGALVHARVRDRVSPGERVQICVPAEHLLVYPEPAQPATGL